MEARAQVRVRRQQIAVAESGIVAAQLSYERSLDRIRETPGLPIEALQSLLALDQARREYLRAATGWGAWEVAARWSYLDLNDADITGNRLNNVTFGVNWYLNKNAKFQLNYIHAMLNSPPDVDSDAGILAVRAQVDF